MVFKIGPRKGEILTHRSGGDDVKNMHDSAKPYVHGSEANVPLDIKDYDKRKSVVSYSGVKEKVIMPYDVSERHQPRDKNKQSRQESRDQRKNVDFKYDQKGLPSEDDGFFVAENTDTDKSVEEIDFDFAKEFHVDSEVLMDFFETGKYKDPAIFLALQAEDVMPQISMEVPEYFTEQQKERMRLTKEAAIKSFKGFQEYFADYKENEVKKEVCDGFMDWLKIYYDFMADESNAFVVRKLQEYSYQKDKSIPFVAHDELSRVFYDMFFKYTSAYRNSYSMDFSMLPEMYSFISDAMPKTMEFRMNELNLDFYKLDKNDEKDVSDFRRRLYNCLRDMTQKREKMFDSAKKLNNREKRAA